MEERVQAADVKTVNYELIHWLDFDVPVTT